MTNTRRKLALIENHELGIYSIRHDLVVALAEKYEVFVLMEMEGTFKNKDLDAVATFINVGKSVLNPLTAAAYINRLKKALKDIKPDICITFTIRPAIYGNLITRALSIPTISTITGTGPLFESNSFAYRIARFLYKRVLKKTRFVAFPNNDDLNAFVERGYVTKQQAIRVPGSGVNADKYAPGPQRAVDGKFIFLFIGRLLKDKGILEYVEAAGIIKKQFPEVEFQVIGPFWSGNKKSLTVGEPELELWIKNNWIVYLGKQDDIIPFIADADCIVMPSYREGMSNVLLEAASMARPLIATDVTGCRDIVENGWNGLLCRPRDGKDLALKMIEMRSMSPNEREVMGRNGRKKIMAEFAKKKVIEIYINKIEEVLNSKLA